jgi:hypothetical protein
MDRERDPRAGAATSTAAAITDAARPRRASRRLTLG